MTNTSAYGLEVASRQAKGNANKRLRKQGLVPANVYGKGVESTAVEVDLKKFQSTYEKAGETGVVNLVVDDHKPVPVLINELFYHPVTGELLHVDFRQVNLKQKITTNVPIEFVGESQAVKQEGATLIVNLEEVEVEALPTEIPESFVVDVAVLVAPGDMITVADLKPAPGVEILDDPETVVAQAQEAREEVEEVVAEETPEPTSSSEAEKANKTDEPAKSA